MSTVTHHQIASYLNSVRSAYPYGVPKVRNVSVDVPQKALSILVPGSLEDVYEQLLNAAINNGLKLRAETIEVVRYKGSELSIVNFKSNIILLLGPRCLKQISELNQKDLTPGEWITISGKNLLYSRDLIEVAKDPATKRLFWEDLKQVIRKVSEHV